MTQANTHAKPPCNQENLDAIAHKLADVMVILGTDGAELAMLDLTDGDFCASVLSLIQNALNLIHFGSLAEHYDVLLELEFLSALLLTSPAACNSFEIYFTYRLLSCLNTAPHLGIALFSGTVEAFCSQAQSTRIIAKINRLAPSN